MAANSDTDSPPVPGKPVMERRNVERRGGLGGLAWVFLILLWAYAIYRLGTLWHSNKDYAFGWFVPLLCLCLFWERWKSRPSRSHVRAASGSFLVQGLAALALLPCAIALEVMPLMRLAGWTFALAIVVLTIIVLYFAGGRSWCRHFAFPVLFFLIAVPWPSRLETPMVDGLSEFNAALSTFTVNLLGTPAIRTGVLIETGPGLVGVDEACSGIRSFQASVMVGLFLGELLRYSFLRRFVLLFGGVGIAFLCNLVRTTYLVRTCDLKGIQAVDVYHDQAGFTILGITFAGLLLLTWLVRPRRLRERKPGMDLEGDDVKPAIARGSAPASDAEDTKRRVTPTTWLRGAVIGVAVWVVGVEVGIEMWFRPFEQRAAVGSGWSLNLPKQNREYRELPIRETVKDILRYDDAVQAEWRDTQGRSWHVYYLRWLAPGNRYQAIRTVAHARGHATDVCLRNAGMSLDRDLGTELIAINGTEIEIKAQRFLSQGRPFYAFTCYWDPHISEFASRAEGGSSWGKTLSRAAAMIQARNRLQVERRVIKIGIRDMDEDVAAQVAVRESLSGMLVSHGPLEQGATAK